MLSFQKHLIDVFHIWRFRRLPGFLSAASDGGRAWEGAALVVDTNLCLEPDQTVNSALPDIHSISKIDWCLCSSALDHPRDPPTLWRHRRVDFSRANSQDGWC